MEIPASGRSDRGGGARGGGYICPLPPKHCCPVYCDSYDTGAMPGGGTAAGSMGINMVVREVYNRPQPMGGEADGEGDGGR